MNEQQRNSRAQAIPDMIKFDHSMPGSQIILIATNQTVDTSPLVQ